MGQQMREITLRLPEETILKKIFIIRGRKVMLDSDLAKLYGVPTGALIQAVKRNSDRFPSDFMYLLTIEEVKSLISQNVISKTGRGGRTKIPHVFTENGVAMLSSVLKSRRAIHVNIHIMRTFTRLREMLQTHEELRRKIEGTERKYDGQFRIVFEAIKELLQPAPGLPKKRIGFHAG